MKTIKEIYGEFASKELVTEMNDLAQHATTILKIRRNDIISKEGGLHNPILSDVIKSLEFWTNIQNQCKEYLK